jgi:predicted nucleotidyltransferase
MNLSPLQLQSITERLGRDTRIAAAYLLGSAARNEMRPDSDVDIAVLPCEGVRLSWMDRLALADGLAEPLGRTVDLGVLDSANLVYAKEAITSGTCILTRDRFRSDLFAATALALYARLREERKEIEDAYRAG